MSDILAILEVFEASDEEKNGIMSTQDEGQGAFRSAIEGYLDNKFTAANNMFKDAMEEDDLAEKIRIGKDAVLMAERVQEARKIVNGYF